MEVTLELPSAHTQGQLFSPWPEELGPSMCHFPGGDDPGVRLAKQVEMLAARVLSRWVLESLEGVKGAQRPGWHGDGEEVGHSPMVSRESP